MFEHTISGFYQRWAQLRLPQGAAANRHLIFDLFSPYPRMNVRYRVYSTSAQPYLDYFVWETFPKVKKLTGKIALDQHSENCIFQFAKEICVGAGCIVLCPQWSERDHVKSRCFIQDNSCGYSYRLVVNCLQQATEAQEIVRAIRKVLDDLLEKEGKRTGQPWS